MKYVHYVCFKGLVSVVVGGWEVGGTAITETVFEFDLVNSSFEGPMDNNNNTPCQLQLTDKSLNLYDIF